MAFLRVYYHSESCETRMVTELEPTELRLERSYIVLYVNWIWMACTAILPFLTLLVLNARIFAGMRRVRQNVRRHQARNASNVANEEPNVVVQAKSGSRSTAVVQSRRRLVSAAQSREANLALVLVSTVTSFLICHTPRVFVVIFEASTVTRTLDCRESELLSIPVWFLYVTPMVRLLQVVNASLNFPILYIMGTAFRDATNKRFKCNNNNNNNNTRTNNNNVAPQPGLSTV